MKRYLSIALILGMMLSLLSIVPVQADDAVAYPYMNYSFDTEDDTSVISTNGPYSIQWSEKGVGDSTGSLYFAMTGDGGDYHMPITCPEILIGQKAKISCWVKLDTARSKVKSDKVKIILWGKTATTTAHNAYQFDWSTTPSKPFNSGEWAKIEYIVDNWDGTMSSDKDKLDISEVVSMSPRFGGNLPDSGNKVDALAADSPENVLAFWMDEVRVEPVAETASTEENDPNVIFFDNGTGGNKVNGGKLTWNSGIGCDGQPGYMSWASNNGDGYCDMSTPNLDINYNTLYKVSLWAKADDDATVGDFAMFNVMRQDRMDKTYDAENGNPPAPYGDYQQIKFEPNLTREWQYYECYFKRNVKSYDDSPLSIWFRGGNDMNGRKFSFDNIKVEKVGESVTNGDFELIKSDIPAPTYTSAGYNSKDDARRYGTFYGWFDKNATVEASADIPAGSDGAQSAKITTTAANAEINQGIYVTNNSDMVFKFWAKGEEESVGKSLQVKLDRTVPAIAQPWNKNGKTMAGDEFTVPNTELLGEDLVLTDEWTEYEVRYTPAFTGGSSANVIPRLPFMSIVVDGGSEGLTYYLDDISYETYVEPSTELLPPTVTDVYAESNMIVKDEVVLDWIFNTSNDALDESLVRMVQVMDNGEEATIAIAPSRTFVIPESAAGKTLRFDILPCEKVPGEEAYLFGDFVSYALSDKVRAAKVITPELGEIGTDAVTGTLYIENNAGETLDLFMLVAVYDENDCAIRYETRNVSVAVGSSENITVSVLTTEAEGFAPVKYAKAFVWGGTGVFDTDMTPYTDVLIVEKN